MAILDNDNNVKIEDLEFAKNKQDDDASYLVDLPKSVKEGGVSSGGSWGRQQLNWLFKKIYYAVKKLNERALDRNRNLGDLTDTSTARANLGLGNAATKNVGVGAGQLMEVGAFGLGAKNAATYLTGNNEADLQMTTGLVGARGNALGSAFSPNNDGGLLTLAGRNDTLQLGWTSSNDLSFRENDTGNGDTTGWSDWREIYHSGNIPAIGVRQTWRNMLGSRAKGEPYTNNTGRPIMVSVTGHHNIALWVSDVRVAHQNTYPYRSGYVASVTGIIPAGAVYRVECNHSLSNWAELR